MTDRSSPGFTMHAFTRKQKPRHLPLTTSAPVHNIFPAPRARVTPLPTTHIPSSSSHAPSNLTLSPPSTFRDAPELPHPAPTSPVTPTAKRRRRFRKKVTGLFGDQTDLKRRMDKLIRDVDAHDLLDNAALVNNPILSPMVPTPQSSTPHTLPAAASIIARLNMVQEARTGLTKLSSRQAKDTGSNRKLSPNASFDAPELTRIAHDVLGSPERLATVRGTMGSLDRRNNERFLEELEIRGQPGPLSLDAVMAAQAPPPPELPMVSAYKDQDQDFSDGEMMDMSPISNERAAAPAVLRKKARRLERGYRREEVLRARLGTTEMGGGGVGRRTEKRIRYRDTSMEEYLRLRKRAKRKVDDDRMQSERLESWKPRRRNMAVVRKIDGMEMGEDVGKRECMSSNPLDMLVAVATVNAAEERRERSESSRVSEGA